MAKKPTTIDAENEDFRKLLGLQKRHNDVVAKLAKLQGELDAVHRDWLKQIVDDAVVADAERERIETEAEVICRKHEGDWFANRQSVKTPLGTAKFHRSTALEVPSEELTMELLKAHKANQPGLRNSSFVRTSISLNLEALGTLPDEVLALLKVRRVPKENFALVPASVDLGKVVKEKAEERKAA